MQKQGLKGLFRVSDTQGGSNDTMGRVDRLESSREILGGKGDLGQEDFIVFSYK